MTIAVVAHSGKILGDGLPALRTALADAGIKNPLWYEVSKSKRAPKAIAKALKRDVDRVFVWGGDGMVQHCADALAGSNVPMAILPAGTANLLATHLGIPLDIERAVAIGLKGKLKPLDLGVMNKERFAVMAGTGFDAEIMGNVSKSAKESLGQLAYFKTGLDAMQKRPTHVTIDVDGLEWFTGDASLVLFGNIGTITAGVQVFESASPRDGLLEIGVVTAKDALEWVRVLGRISTIGNAQKSPLIQLTKGKKIRVKLAEKRPYELDGSARGMTKRLKVRIEPRALLVCAPK